MSPRQRGEGGFALGGFLALALAAGQFRAAVMHGTLENAVVVRAGGGDDVILRGLGRDGLQQLLQLALGIFKPRNFGKAIEVRTESPEYEIARGVETGIQKHRADHGLEGVGQRRGAFPSPVQLLALAQDQGVAQGQIASALGQRAAIHQLGPGLGQRPFAEVGKLLEQRARQDQLEDGVAEELQPLVCLNRSALFVGNGRMGERKSQQIHIVEFEFQKALEIVELGHFRKRQ